MTDFKSYLIQLNKNLNILEERRAKYSGNEPVDLINQIDDHKEAIELTERAIAGEMSEAEWQEALRPLLVVMQERTGEAAVNISDLANSVVSIGSHIAQVSHGGHAEVNTSTVDQHGQQVWGSQYNTVGDININYSQPAARPQLRPPFQLPASVDHFTGRRTELAQLLDELQPGHVATLCGPGGMGKTALAAEALQDDAIPKRFPDGIIFYSFYGKPDPALALAHIVASFRDEARPTLDDAARRVLAGKRVLLVLDGAEEATDLQAVLGVRGDQCGVLVTSQSNEDALGEWQDIDRLPVDDAVKLLRAWGKEQATDLTVVAEICEEVGGLPMALCLVGRYLSKKREPAREYLAWLKSDPIDALTQGEHRHENVERLIERSLSHVSEMARQVLGVAGLLALASFDRAVVGAALDRSATGLGRPVGQLVSYGLLLREGKRYRVGHALIHTYARRRLVVPTEGLERVAGYYNAFAREQSKQGPAGYARLDAEREHMMRVLAGCIEQKRWGAAKDLVWTLDRYLKIQGHIAEYQTALEYGIIAARQLGNRWIEGAFLGSLGLVYLHLGKIEQAIEYFEQALNIAREVGDRPNQGITLGNLGLAYDDLGQMEKAIKYHEQALVISNETGNRQNEGSDLGNLGIVYGQLGQIEKAIEYFEQALVISREVEDRQEEGRWLGNLGLAYYSLGQMEKAIEYHEQALVISREIGNRQSEGITLGNLGLAYDDLGQMEKAIEYHEQALVISHEIGNRQSESFHAWNLGLHYQETDPARAVDLMSILVDFEREIGHPEADTHAEEVAKIEARLANEKEADEGVTE